MQFTKILIAAALAFTTLASVVPRQTPPFSTLHYVELERNDILCTTHPDRSPTPPQVDGVLATARELAKAGQHCGPWSAGDHLSQIVNCIKQKEHNFNLGYLLPKQDPDVSAPWANLLQQASEIARVCRVRFRYTSPGKPGVPAETWTAERISGFKISVLGMTGKHYPYPFYGFIYIRGNNELKVKMLGNFSNMINQWGKLAFEAPFQGYIVRAGSRYVSGNGTDTNTDNEPFMTRDIAVTDDEMAMLKNGTYNFDD